MAKLIEERDALIILATLAEPADEKVGSLVAQFGGIAALEKLQTELNSLSKKLASADFSKMLKAADDYLAISGNRILTKTDDEWPAKISDLDFVTPLCLWVSGEGELNQLAVDSVGVVGARAATSYGERVASEIGATLGQWGITSISGAAYGIDAAVHRGSISAGGPTIAVLSCGIDIAYPSAHRALLDRIKSDGVVISESAPGSPPLKQRFLTRNRLIAALSREVVVVEAALRSGSLSTANWANSIGRKVWGVPGPITSATSAGVHQAIRNQNMQIMLEPNDLLQLVSE